MLIKEYLEAGNSIISNTTQALFSDFLTSEGQTVINNNFKYQYFNREMVQTGQAHIDELAQYVLLKNKLEYSKIYDSLMTTIDATKTTSKETNSGKDTKDNTGTQGNSTTFGKTVTTTPDEQTVTTTPAAHTVTTTPAGDTVTHTPTGNTVTHTPVGYTDTHTPNSKTTTHTLPGQTVAESGSEQNTVTKSSKAFDSSDFEAVEQEVSNRVPTNKQTQTTYQNNESTTESYTGNETNQRTYSGNESTQTTYSGNETTTTVYNNNASEVTTYQNNESVTNVVNHAGSAVESGTEGTTRTDNLKEELTHGHIIDREEKDPSAIIDNFEKLREFYSLNLWNRITSDLLHFICLDVWNTSYFDM